MSAVKVLAPNPGPMTLEGTNTWLLHGTGEQALLIDPGPDDAGHLRAVLDAAERRGLRIVEILLTHGHADHSEGAPNLAGLTGAPVRALDPAHRLGDEGLGEGDVVALDGLQLRVLATPGHTADSLCFYLPDEASILTGDTVLGRGSTVVMHPEGRLGDYLASLHRLRALADEGVTTVLPGHGPTLHDAAAALDGYLAHREQRLEQIRSALAAGLGTPHEVVATVYADVPQALWPAAELSVRAQLDYLRA